MRSLCLVACGLAACGGTQVPAASDGATATGTDSASAPSGADGAAPTCCYISGFGLATPLCSCPDPEAGVSVEAAAGGCTISESRGANTVSIGPGQLVSSCRDDGGPVEDARAGDSPTACGCQLPDASDRSLPFCNRVCNGQFTDWTDPSGNVCWHLDCGLGNVCKYYPSGSAYCTLP